MQTPNQTLAMECRKELITFTAQDIVNADHDLLLGATEDFDGKFLPLATQAKPNQLIAMMTDQQVIAILGYLKR